MKYLSTIIGAVIGTTVGTFYLKSKFQTIEIPIFPVALPPAPALSKEQIDALKAHILSIQPVKKEEKLSPVSPSPEQIFSLLNHFGLSNALSAPVAAAVVALDVVVASAPALDVVVASAPVVETLVAIETVAELTLEPTTVS